MDEECPERLERLPGCPYRDRNGIRGGTSQVRNNLTGFNAMSELFPEMSEQLSPRLRWQEDKRIKTLRREDGKWVAFKSETSHSYTDEVELDAVIGLAKKLKLKLWNE